MIARREGHGTKVASHADCDRAGTCKDYLEMWGKVWTGITWPDLMRGRRGPHRYWRPEAMASRLAADERAGGMLVGSRSCRVFGDVPGLVPGANGKRHCSRLGQWLLSNLDVRSCSRRRVFGRLLELRYLSWHPAA